MAGGFQSGAFQSNAFQIGFSEAVSSAYVRMMSALFPPGKLWRFVGSTLGDFLKGCADELARVEARAEDLIDEANPSKAVELLPEYESELGIAAAATDPERRANIVARLVARQRFRPVDFQTALAALLGTVVVIERTAAQAAAMGDPREIYHFFIYRDPTLPGSYFVASAQALVDSMKPSHTIGTVIESINALWDDPFSLWDRDILGA